MSVKATRKIVKENTPKNTAEAFDYSSLLNDALQHYKANVRGKQPTPLNEHEIKMFETLANAIVHNQASQKYFYEKYTADYKAGQHQKSFPGVEMDRSPSKFKEHLYLAVSRLSEKLKQEQAEELKRKKIEELKRKQAELEESEKAEYELSGIHESEVSEKTKG